MSVKEYMKTIIESRKRTSLLFNAWEEIAEFIEWTRRAVKLQSGSLANIYDRLDALERQTKHECAHAQEVIDGENCACGGFKPKQAQAEQDYDPYIELAKAAIGFVNSVEANREPKPPQAEPRICATCADTCKSVAVKDCEHWNPQPKPPQAEHIRNCLSCRHDNGAKPCVFDAVCSETDSRWQQKDKAEQGDDRTRMSVQVSDGEGPHPWRTVTETQMNGTVFEQKAEQGGDDKPKYCISCISVLNENNDLRARLADSNKELLTRDAIWLPAKDAEIEKLQAENAELKRVAEAWRNEFIILNDTMRDVSACNAYDDDEINRINKSEVKP